MIHQALDRHAGLHSPLHRLDARAKILVALAFVVINVSTPREAYPAFGAYLAFLVLLIAVSRLPPSDVLKRLLVTVPFVLLVAVFVPFLPSGQAGDDPLFGFAGLTVSRHGLLVLWNVVAKAWLGVLAVIWLTGTTGFAGLLRGLQQLRVPRLLVALLGFTYRYAFVFVEEALRMKRARDARGYRGRWIWQAGTIGRMIGSLFLRGYERGERIYWAMQSRGYDGSVPALGAARFRLVDAGFLVAGLTVLVALRILVP